MVWVLCCKWSLSLLRALTKTFRMSSSPPLPFQSYQTSFWASSPKDSFRTGFHLENQCYEQISAVRKNMWYIALPAVSAQRWPSALWRKLQVRSSLMLRVHSLVTLQKGERKIQAKCQWGTRCLRAPYLFVCLFVCLSVCWFVLHPDCSFPPSSLSSPFPPPLLCLTPTPAQSLDSQHQGFWCWAGY